MTLLKQSRIFKGQVWKEKANNRAWKIIEVGYKYVTLRKLHMNIGKKLILKKTLVDSYKQL